MSYWIGPVQLVDLVEPSLSFTGTPTALGLQPGQITGQTEWWQAHQLKELVNNPHRRVTIGGQSGVLEPIYFSDPMLGPLTSWCLLQSFQLGQADQSHSLQGTTGLVPYTLTLTQIGDGTQRQVVIVRSARAKTNDYGLTAQSVVVNPFWDEDAAGSPFITSPGGTRFTREYDASFPHTVSPTPESRQVSIYTAPFVAGVDGLASVILPSLPVPLAGAVPAWISSRSLDARGYDRREEREVYGPSHHTAATTDLKLINGLCNFWIGNRGVRPFLHCQSFASGDWREPGTVQFGTDSDVLMGARLVRVTTDEVTAALSVQNWGDIFVTLRRGETELRCTQPIGMPLPTWSGLPPTSRLNSARVDTAHYTNGLIAGADVQDNSWAAPFTSWAGDLEHNWDGSPYVPDLRLRWPADVAPSNWQRAFRYKPLGAVAALGTVGLLTIYDAAGVAQVELYVDGADQKAKVRVADTVVVTSSVLFFVSADDIVVGLSYDGTTLTLSWRANNGTISTVSAAAAIAASAFYDEAYFVNFARWGDGSWGDGSWGGTTYYPGGLVDNDMVFERALTASEFAILCSGTKPLANLPTENGAEGTLRRYVPFDAEPIVVMPALSGGRSVDSATDANGFQKVAAAIKSDLTDVAAYLARTDTGSTAADQHAQAASQNDQQVRVR